MIVRPRPHWLPLLFVWRGSVLPRILPQLAIGAAFSLGVTWLHLHIPNWTLNFTPYPFSFIGIALAIFLAFRNNASYERYLEARKLWGQLLNGTRTLARQIQTLPHPTDTEATPHPADPDYARPFVHTLIAFVHALRHQLRGSDATQDLARWLTPDDCANIARARFGPAMILLRLSQQLQVLRQQHRLEPILQTEMERSLSSMNDVLGGCERLAGTPIPFTYSVILHRTVYTYCLLLPLGLVEALGWLTPIIVIFVAYTFLSLEALCEEIENPFGTTPNDLPLDALAQGIEFSLRETLGEHPLPPPMQACNYVLT